MKKIVLTIVLVCMSVVGIYYVLSLTNLNERFSSGDENSKQGAVQALADNPEGYTDFEKKLMRTMQVGGVGHLNEPIQTTGYSVMISDVQVYDNWEAIGIPEAKEHYEEMAEQFEYWSDCPCLVAKVTVTNENADSYFENGPKVELCLGNIMYERFDKNGNFINGAELRWCTNDQHSPFSVDGFMYDLEQGDSYKGLLVYPLEYEDEAYDYQGFYVGFLADRNNSTEERIILMDESK